MTTYRNKLHALMDDGVISESVMANTLIGWLSEAEAKEVYQQSDIIEMLATEEEEPEQVVDGVQARMVIHNGDPTKYHATIHMIDDTGTTMAAAYSLDASDYSSMHEEVCMEDAEQVIDWLRDRDGLPYCDWYLDENDPVIWTDQ